MDQPPPLQRIHSDETLNAPLFRRSLEYWRAQETQTIVDSLAPTKLEALRTFADGRIKNGNTLIKVLEERGYDINALPREVDPEDLR